MSRKRDASDFDLADAVGRNDHARAIEVLRSRASLSVDEICFVAQCHAALGDVQRAIDVAHEALCTNGDCFEAHRMLASIYADRNDHGLGELHARHAVRVFRAPARLPAWLVRISIAIAWLTRGRRVADVVRGDLRSMGEFEARWVEWAGQYIRWSETRDTLTAGNDPAPTSMPLR